MQGEMPTAAIALMAGMQGAIVNNFKCTRFQRLQALRYRINQAHQGSVFLKGLTMTLL